VIVSAKRCDVVVVRGQVHCLNTTWVRFEEGTDWSGGTTVPHDEHGVVAGVGRHHPLFVVTAENRGDLVAVTL
jgi:hypothetical protein